ncbi:hypothetical protein CkaCkLH20_01868 [Colletotrichum karsti]|uniref:lytic cellulose monooxygenase (C4-dehydrogenating) n=1 Tax=Colletotrichum karsti TaxID=1095194 RepID=A0A9P6IF92_9PEZI|nr:uncharacterized protein CkaCkLH20_01868 [Colletotrichum karsti]KAF9880826.1 hypothetical protein CkaCkLH20_01868 [Colletotrichum karsti]
MPSFKTTAIASALVGAVSVLGHGHVNYITIDGTKFDGYDVTSYPYKADPPKTYGWSATNTDNGFVDPASYGSGDIICHKGAKNAALTAKAAAGSTVKFFWNTWPESHKGPIIDYLAPCGSDCSTVDKATLEFFKIHETGLNGTTWASDTLIADNNTWTMKIPENTKAGLYVLRHEIIALHSAGQENGAQNYPQCFNIEVTGSGTAAPAGTLGEKLYTASEAGILISIYNNLKSYTIPGPAFPSVFGNSGSSDSGSGSASSAAASAPAATSAAAASSAPAATSAPAAATTTAAAEAVTTSAAASSAPAATSAAAAQPTKPSCAEKRRRRLARRMAREHAVVRN